MVLRKEKGEEITQKSEQGLPLLEVADDKGQNLALEVPRNSASEALAGPELD